MSGSLQGSHESSYTPHEIALLIPIALKVQQECCSLRLLCRASRLPRASLLLLLPPRDYVSSPPNRSMRSRCPACLVVGDSAVRSLRAAQSLVPGRSGRTPGIRQYTVRLPAPVTKPGPGPRLLLPGPVPGSDAPH